MSNSTAIHILGESIAINKAIQKRQVQTRQREQQPDLIRTQGQQAGPFRGCLHWIKKKKVMEEEEGRERQAGPG